MLAGIGDQRRRSVGCTGCAKQRKQHVFNQTDRHRPAYAKRASITQRVMGGRAGRGRRSSRATARRSRASPMTCQRARGLLPAHGRETGQPGGEEADERQLPGLSKPRPGQAEATPARPPQTEGRRAATTMPGSIRRNHLGRGPPQVRTPVSAGSPQEGQGRAGSGKRKS